ASLGCWASRFGSTPPGRRSNGGFSSYARSIPMPGPEACGRIGSPLCSCARLGRGSAASSPADGSAATAQTEAALRSAQPAHSPCADWLAWPATGPAGCLTWIGSSVSPFLIAERRVLSGCLGTYGFRFPHGGTGGLGTLVRPQRTPRPRPSRHSTHHVQTPSVGWRPPW